MKLDELEEGMRFKNYPRLCEFINEEVKSGCSKTSQCKEWKRYFDFTKEGNAIIITEIYDTPKLSEDKRRRYQTYIEPLLLHYLSQYMEPIEVEHTYKQWSVEIGLTSGKAYDESIQEQYIEPGSEWKPLAYRRARLDIQTLTRQALTSTTNSLEKQGILKTTDNYYIVINNATRLATSEETAYIKQVKNRILKEMNVKNMYPINMSVRKGEEYNRRTKEIYMKEKGWDKVYLLLKIEVMNTGVVCQYETINQEEVETAIRQELMDRLREKLDNEHDPEEDIWEYLGNKFRMTAELKEEIEEWILRLI